MVLSKEFCHNQILEMLSDDTTYKMLNSDPTQAYRKQLETLINIGTRSGVLSIKEQGFLVPTSSRIPTIYTLPKVHKDITNPPARPIVNSIGSISSRQYFDLFLQKKCSPNSLIPKGHQEFPKLPTTSGSERKRRSVIGDSRRILPVLYNTA